MKKGLLIITQKIDKNDPGLGFFYNWVERLSKVTPRLTVICLGKDPAAEIPGVKILSLGKERGVGRLGYLKNLFYFLWQERDAYDTVFVHMNQEYVLLAGWLWKITGKKIFLWRNHPLGSFLTRLAVAMSDRVFCTSKNSFTAQFKKTKIMPAGIDTDFFRPDPAISKKPNSILALGRISSIKYLEFFVEALLQLDKENLAFPASLVGSPANPEDYAYEQKLQAQAEPLVKNGRLIFAPAVTPDKIKAVYQSHQIYINITPTGSLDKTILEAMACGCVPVVLNQSFKEILGEDLVIPGLSAGEIAERLKGALRNGQNKNFREWVVANHDLGTLIKKLKDEFDSE